MENINHIVVEAAHAATSDHRPGPTPVGQQLGMSSIGQDMPLAGHPTAQDVPQFVLAMEEQLNPMAFGPPRGWYATVKFVVEWLLAALIAIVSLPVMLVCGVVVKLTSRGPVLYCQRRVGRLGRVYTIYKLRTMRHDSEATTGAVWSVRGDQRITPVGHFLRDTHLDELPQVFNILLGHMSLIGPRPERPEIVAKLRGLVPLYDGRLRVRPGVTGLAQMRLPADRNLDDVKRKVAHDLYYIEKMNPWLDFRLALCTGVYFLGAASTAMCGLLVGKYGRAVEQNYAITSAVPAE